MGGDGQYLNGWQRVRSTNPKIFRLGGMLIGTERSQRVSDIIQYNLCLKEDFRDSPEEYLAKEFIPSLINSLGGLGALISKEGTDEMDAAIMVGYKGRLFIIGEDFTLSQIGSEYEAIGAGARYAMGYLYAVLGGEKAAIYNPSGAIGGALACAAHFSAAVSEPFTILEI